MVAIYSDVCIVVTYVRNTFAESQAI